MTTHGCISLFHGVAHRESEASREKHALCGGLLGFGGVRIGFLAARFSSPEDDASLLIRDPVWFEDALILAPSGVSFRILSARIIRVR